MALGGAGVVGVGRVKILPDMAGFKASVSKGVQNSMASTAKKVGRTMAKAVTAGVLGIAGASVKLAVDVEKSLRSVNSLFGLTGEKAEKSFRQMQKGVADLSSEMGIAQDVLSEGLYQAISAGVPKENAFTFMRTAAKAAVAGVTDTNTAVEGISKVINAFGLKFSDAEMVADSMFTTVNKGIVTFEEMSSSMFQVAPAAAAAGIGLKETNAAITALTLQGIPMAEAATRVQAALVAVARNGKELDPIFKKLGIESAEAALKQKGLQFVLDAIYKAAGGTQSKLLDYLGRIEAVQATNVLAGAKAGVFTQALKDQEKATGASSLAFKEMEKSAARKLERALTDLKNAGIQIGNVLIPIVSQIAKKVSEWAKAFSNLNPETRKMILQVAGFTAVLGPALRILSPFSRAIGGAFRQFAVGRSALKAGAGSLGMIGRIIAGLRMGPLIGLGIAVGVVAVKLWSMTHATSASERALKRWRGAVKAAKDAANELADAQLDKTQDELNLVLAKREKTAAGKDLIRLRKSGQGGTTEGVAAKDAYAQSVINLARAERTLAETKTRLSEASIKSGKAERKTYADRRAIAAGMVHDAMLVGDARESEQQQAVTWANAIVQSVIPALKNETITIGDVSAALKDVPERVRSQVEATILATLGLNVKLTAYGQTTPTNSRGRKVTDDPQQGDKPPTTGKKPPKPKGKPKIGHKGLRLTGGHAREGFVWARGGETIRTAQQEQQLGIFMRGVHERMRQQSGGGQGAGPQVIRGKLSIDERGQAYIYGVARSAGRDELDERSSHSATTRRMSHR